MPEHITAIWKNADAVCFDVDSTVIENEAIDEIAAFCGKSEQVKEMTKWAMSGKIEFREALARRLDIISPTVSQMRDFINRHPLRLTKNIRELVYRLQKKRVAVYLVSGGFRCTIRPIAQELNIPPQNIYANKLKFFNGYYAGFDEDEFTSRTGGKALVIDELKKKHGYKSIIMIGDGMTDAEACPPADAFIGFGGNVIREAVKAKSDWFVTDFQELIDAL
jgi:phosphoserine phosphatase